MSEGAHFATNLEGSVFGSHVLIIRSLICLDLWSFLKPGLGGLGIVA